MINSAAIPAPIPGLAAGSGTIYTKNVGAPLASQVFYTPDASGAEFQITTALPASIAQFGVMAAYGTPPVNTTQNGGYTFLPGGLILQYGFFTFTTISITAATTKTIQFPISFPTGCFAIYPTWTLSIKPTGNSTLGVILGSITPAQYDISWTGGAEKQNGVYWWAIGN